MINNKGLSIVEIIISVSLISIVIVFLLNVLITVRDEDERGKATSNLLMNQALITKEIESDFINLGLIEIASCNDGALQPDRKDTVLKILPASSSLRTGTGHCLKFVYDPAKTTDNIGYLLFYSYGFSATEQINVVGYRRGSARVLRETPNLYNEFGTYKNTCSTIYCTLRIDLPAYNDDGEDFGIHLSYIYEKSLNFKITSLTNDTKYHFKVNS